MIPCFLFLLEFRGGSLCREIHKRRDRKRRASTFCLAAYSMSRSAFHPRARIEKLSSLRVGRFLPSFFGKGYRGGANGSSHECSLPARASERFCLCELIRLMGGNFANRSRLKRESFKTFDSRVVAESLLSVVPGGSHEGIVLVIKHGVARSGPNCMSFSVHASLDDLSEFDRSPGMALSEAGSVCSPFASLSLSPAMAP